jgi:predicted Fe-S protein YdhL (DUF1289 family)
MIPHLDAHILLAKKYLQISGRCYSDHETVPSPCVSVCRLDLGGRLCEGCLRTLDELRDWGRVDNAGKQAIWARVVARLDTDVEQRKEAQP